MGVEYVRDRSGMYLNTHMYSIHPAYVHHNLLCTCLVSNQIRPRIL
jgi:hypothetical protein